MLHLCTQRVRLQPLIGVFDRKHTGNPFKSYTVIHVGYCSGDAHAGNMTHDWKGPGGASVAQSGFYNTESVLRWMKENLGELRNFVISGSSAGSLAAQLWSRRLLQDFTYANAAVIADSYAGVFPRRVQGKIFKSAGVCRTDLVSPRLQQKCENGTLTLQDTFASAMYHFPDVAFASVNSKTDIVQMNFYDAMVFSVLRRQGIISPSDFYARLAVIQDFYGRNKNHISFDVNSIDHTYINTQRIFSTIVGNTNLNVWLGKLPVLPGESVASKCDGSLGSSASMTGWDWCQPNSTENVFYRDTEAHKILEKLEEEFEDI